VERKRRAAIDRQIEDRKQMVSETADRSPDQAAELRLQRTIDIVCEDAARVELWACALSGFAQPVPDYGLGTAWGRASKPNEG
jgi:hypothetical protein